jgi:MFS transporter, DHA2 family, multidrug resistance protein
VAVMMMMPIVGMLLSKYEARWLVIVGLLVSSLGLFQMSHFDLEIGFRNAVMARIVQSLGLAFLFVPINTAAFYFVSRENTSYATGLINLARNIGGSTGIALATTFLARREQLHQQRLIEHVSSLDGPYRATLDAAKQMFLSKGADAVYAASQAQQMIYNMVHRQAQMLSFVENFRMFALTFLAVIPLVFLMKKTRAKKDGAGTMAI